MTDYKILRRIADSLAMIGEDPPEDFLRRELTFGFGFNSRYLRCFLCRIPRGSPKAFSKDRAVCKSCAMKGKPTKIYLEARLAVWIGGIDQADFAKWLEVSQPRVSQLATAPYCNGNTGARIATALVASAPLHNGMRRIRTEWPGALALADEPMVYALRARLLPL